LALYLTGLALAWKSLPHLPRSDRTTFFLLALAYEPFVMECWIAGQLSAVGFFCAALAWYLVQRGRPFAGGLAVGLLVYKPPLLVLLVPMLVVARQFRMLAGFAVTAVILAGVSIVGVGWECSWSYADTVLHFAQRTSGGALEIRLWKYVDLNSFARLLFGGPSLPATVLAVAAAIGPLVVLLRTWWRYPKTDLATRQMTWATTLCWTLVLNYYVGVYDTVFVVLTLLLTVDVFFLLDKQSEITDTTMLRVFAALLFLLPWLSQPVAQVTHVQTLTLLLFAIGVYGVLPAIRLPV